MGSDMEYIDDEEDDESYEEGDDSEDEVIQLEFWNFIFSVKSRTNFAFLCFDL